MIAVMDHSSDPAELNRRARQVMAKRQKELKAAARMEPADWQKIHSPTVKETATLEISELGEKKRVQSTLRHRRLTDARLWDALDVDQQDAALQVFTGYRALVSGLGVKPSSLEVIGGGRGDLSERQALGATAYNAWIEEVDCTLLLDPETGRPMTFGRGKAKDRLTLERLVPEVATEIICRGKTVDEVAAERGKRRYWVLENLKQALNVWCYRSGTKRRPRAIPVEDTNEGLTLKQVLVRQRNRRVDRVADMLTERKRVLRSAKLV